MKVFLQLAVVGAVTLLTPAYSGAARPYAPKTGDPVTEPWRWSSFTELAGAGLRCVTESPDGVIWFGLDDGVVRYDGSEWGAIEVDRAPTNCLLASGDRVWAGTDAGVFLHEDGAPWRRVFPTEGEVPWNISALTVDSTGRLWAASEWGLLDVLTPRVYTDSTRAAVLSLIDPGLAIEVVPDHVVPKRPWRPGIGIRVVEGHGHLDAVVIVSDAEGIEPGARVHDVEGNPEVLQVYLDGPASTRVTISSTTDGTRRKADWVRRPVDGTFRDFAVYDVFSGRDDAIWLGVSSRMDGGEVVRFDRQSGEWSIHGRRDGVATGYRPRVHEARDGRVWVASFDDTVGVSVLADGSWASVKLDDRRNTNTSILEAGDGTIWVGGNGRFHVLRGSTWKRYARPTVPIPRARILSMVEGVDGAIWMASRGQEAVRLDYGDGRWSTLEGLRFLCDTDEGATWFLSEDRRLVRRVGGTWLAFDTEDGVMSEPVNGYVLRDGRLVVTGADNGSAAVTIFDGQTFVTRSFPGFAPSVDARGFYEARDGSFWLGASWPWHDDQDGGVIRVDGDSVSRYRPIVDVPQFVRGICQTEDGDVWVVGAGISRFDGERWRVEGPDALLRSGLNWVNAAHSSRNGEIWLGTRSYGVYRYDGRQWTRYGVASGLADNAVQALTELGDGSLLVATDKGLSRFDGNEWTGHVVGVGLPPIFFSGLRESGDGDIWLNLRDHRTLRYRPDRTPPETEMEVSSVRTGEDVGTTIPWRGLDPWKRTLPEAMRFAWRIDGGPWSPFTDRSRQTLPALPAGEHVFEVVARDVDFNVDPTPARLSVEVVAPWWRRPWVVVITLSGLTMLCLQTARVIRRDHRLVAANQALGKANLELFDVNAKLRQRSEELERARIKLEEADALRTDFFSSVSHELRTPMTAIKGYLDNLIDGIAGDLSERQARYVERIKVNSDRLTRLVDDLLDLQRLNRERPDLLNLTLENLDVAEVVEEAVESIRPLADQAGLTLTFAGRRAIARIDRDRVVQIVTNLVGNALKFTESGGAVSVTCDLDGEGSVLTVVTDTGCGIPAGDLARVFDPFQQVAGTRGGTGLGLPIAQELASVMGGQITAESEVGVGSTFTFKLPESS